MPAAEDSPPPSWIPYDEGSATEETSRPQVLDPQEIAGLPPNFKIPDFGTPLIVQGAGDWNCYDHSSRGVVEWIVNRARCGRTVKDDKIIPLNQEIPRLSASTATRNGAWTKWHARRRLPDDDLGEAFWPMHYFEMPEIKSRLPEGTSVEQDLLFTSHRGKIYEPLKFDADGDHATGYGAGLRTTADSRHPAGQELDLWQQGGVHQPQLDKVKVWMKKHESPVFFIFKPLNADYWHAAYIVGWNEKGFVIRDSSFGKNVSDKYRGGKISRDLMVMPYSDFLDSAKAAAGYRLKGENCPASSEPAGSETSGNAGAASTDLPTMNSNAHVEEERPTDAPKNTTSTTPRYQPTSSHTYQFASAPSRAPAYQSLGEASSVNGQANTDPTWTTAFYQAAPNTTVPPSSAPPRSSEQVLSRRAQRRGFLLFRRRR